LAKTNSQDLHQDPVFLYVQFFLYFLDVLNHQGPQELQGFPNIARCTISLQMYYVICPTDL